MRTPKVYTIQTDNTREVVETTYSQDGFIFYSDGDIWYSDSDSPAVDEIIPILANEKQGFEKAKSFFVRWLAGTKIFLTPFDL